MLDQTLLAAAQAGKSITTGTLVLDPQTLREATARKYAVNLLNKATIDGNTKMASVRCSTCSADPVRERSPPAGTPWGPLLYMPMLRLVPRATCVR